MLLNLQKRYLLLRVLPVSGSLDGQLRCKELGARLTTLSDEYKEKIEFDDIGHGQFKYNLEKDELTEFELSESEKHVLKRGVDVLDKEEKITLELLDICKEIKDM